MLVKILNTTNGIGTTMTTEQLKGILDQTFNEARDVIDGSGITEDILSIVNVIKANNGSRTFAFLGSVPGVKEWIGSKIYSDLKEYNYVLRNKYFYNALTLHKKEIRQNGLVDVPMILGGLLQEHKDHKKEMIVDALIAGTTELAYDGIAFFSNASGVRINDNLLAGAGVTLANIKTDVAAARLAMASFEGVDSGKLLRIYPDTVVCPLALEGTFLELMRSTSDPTQANTGKVNISAGYIKRVIADPALDAEDANDWYFLSTTKAIKPLILQTEDMNNGQEYENVLDEAKFASDGILGYSIESGKVVGYGIPATAIKVVNT